MRESYSVKYCEKKKWFELVLGPFTFDGIVDLLGKEQQMNVLQLHLFQDNNEDLNDYELNEDFFSGMSLSLGQFSDILSVIENYEILSLVFEMEEGAQVKMEEGVVSVLVKKSREDLLLKVVTMLNSVNDEKLFQRLAANAYEPANLTNCQGFQPFPVVMDLSWIAIYPNGGSPGFKGDYTGKTNTFIALCGRKLTGVQKGVAVGSLQSLSLILALSLICSTFYIGDNYDLVR